MDLYQGVMFQSYRAHVRAGGEPAVLILSARHGFLDPAALLKPYEERMSPARADQFLAGLDELVQNTPWPTDVRRVLLAGGKEYRRVMRAAIARRYSARICINEATSGIGMQRSQLGEFLRSVAPTFSDCIGQHGNGMTTFRRYGWLEAGAVVDLRYRAAPAVSAERARVLSLFLGPAGPTAEVEVDRVARGHVKPSPRWVAVTDLAPQSIPPKHMLSKGRPGGPFFWRLYRLEGGGRCLWWGNFSI
ncbi:hypothetical protein K6V06_16995 [Cupriavidus sp. AU9028]|nr:DUF6884 domain-containing protein [Cupriavidus sp. AU9028]MBY4898706.1 hypothetical protein [Cupriavidus sp. AU9028]